MKCLLGLRDWSIGINPSQLLYHMEDPNAKDQREPDPKPGDWRNG